MNSKLQPITNFDALTDSQRDQLHNWLDEGVATRNIMTKLKDEFGFVITYNKLYRYGKRLLQSRLLVDTADHNDTAQNIRTYLDMLNGNPVPYDEAGLALIQKRAFEAACAPKLRSSQLATLQRVFHYKTARAECARRAELNEQSAQIRAERQQITRAREARAQEMHTHKIQLDLRKQTHKEKTAAFKQDLALARLNPHLNLTPNPA